MLTLSSSNKYMIYYTFIKWPNLFVECECYLTTFSAAAALSKFPGKSSLAIYYWIFKANLFYSKQPSLLIEKFSQFDVPLSCMLDFSNIEYFK